MCDAPTQRGRLLRAVSHTLIRAPRPAATRGGGAGLVGCEGRCLGSCATRPGKACMVHEGQRRHPKWGVHKVSQSPNRFTPRPHGHGQRTIWEPIRVQPQRCHVGQSMYFGGDHCRSLVWASFPLSHLDGLETAGLVRRSTWRPSLADLGVALCGGNPNRPSPSRSLPTDKGLEKAMHQETYRAHADSFRASLWDSTFGGTQ